VVFALGLLLPGGGAGNRASKTQAPGIGAPPGRPPTVIFFPGRISIDIDRLSQQKQVKQKQRHQH
ncbi:hypothetical protein ACVGXU_23565, partial [Enterobacter hormaechei]